MTKQQTTIGRRSFLKASALAGGGLMISFSWLNSFASGANKAFNETNEAVTLNGYLKIAPDGTITIMSPNPEGGQNIKTSMPMIVAEELDADWAAVTVEQAPLNTKLYTRQYIGGSQAIRTSWNTLRTAGASARAMLCMAAATAWKVPVEEISAQKGKLYHKGSGRSASYGQMASAAAKLKVPEKVTLKNKDDFKIIGTSQKMVDVSKITSGQPLYGIDMQREGMLIAMVIHPPAFGMKLKSFDADAVKKMPGITDVFAVKVFNEDYERQYFDTCTFNEVVAITGKNTWAVMKAKKALQVSWEPFDEYSFKRRRFNGPEETILVPAGLESTEEHLKKMAEMNARPGKVERKDGDPEAAFKTAAKLVESTYTAPFLAHNCMEPVNFFAHFTPEKIELAGPLQKAELTEQALAVRLGIPVEKIDIQLTRLGGGFGRKSYAHFLIEAALISQKLNAPVKLIYEREDDMTSGIYRPMYMASFRAALDADNNLTAFHVKAGGIPEGPLSANRFPAGAVDNYLAESWKINSNITTGSFRAPGSNFMAAAEQSFLDEVAEAAGKDPIDFRLELLERTQQKPVGKDNDYDASRYAGVIKLVKEKSAWGKNTDAEIHRGISAYFCHNTYVAEVVDVVMQDKLPVVLRVCCAVDCGIVINPDAAISLTEGAIVDGVGNALYGEMRFKDGVPQKSNFYNYRMIRHHEAPKAIDVHFVKNNIDPTGMGEPAFPPVFAALANALYKATGKRLYDQPFMPQIQAGNDR